VTAAGVVFSCIPVRWMPIYLMKSYWKYFYLLIIGLMLSILSDVPAPSDHSKQIHTNVTGLNPYTMYRFRALGVNILGEGRPSKPSSEFRTLHLMELIENCNTYLSTECLEYLS